MENSKLLQNVKDFFEYFTLDYHYKDLDIFTKKALIRMDFLIQIQEKALKYVQETDTDKIDKDYLIKILTGHKERDIDER